MRIRHRITNATGTIRDAWWNATPFAGDLAGWWVLVEYDDGLTCWNKYSEVQPA